jgi:hypothetical protein
MRAAGGPAPEEIGARYTQILLPGGTGPATPAAIRRSPYARVSRLARRLARGEDTTYDVVRAVQRHLRGDYTYDERPPRRRFPLAAFLFRDRVGYCQQFSGAMALMLRMLNIPARVAAGFTPGSYNRDTKEYRVRDLDAHSWVEVWFKGIGWVPFDPTPSIAPADSQSSAEAASASRGSGATGEIPDVRADRGGTIPQSTGGAGDGGGGDQTALDAWMVLVAAALIALAALGVASMRSVVRRRAPLGGEERDLAELRRALARTGRPLPPRTTLRQLESTLERTAGAAAVRYVEALRARRYAPRGGDGPDGAARRELRRALGRGRGPRGRLAALLALPPVSFRRG